jgi:hypothetical protein
MDAITSYQKSHARLETQNKFMEQQLTLLSRYISSHQRQDTPAEIKKIVQTYSKRSFGSKITSFSSKFIPNEEEEDPKKIYKSGLSSPNLFSKISKEELFNAINREKNTPESDRKFVMKKSMSVQSGLIANNLKNYPLKVLDEKSENEYRKTESFRNDMLKESLKELGKRSSGYFASTHEQIQQERLFEQQLKHDFDENLKKLDEKLQPSFIDDLNLFQGRKTMSLNLNSNVNKDDSGFVTPLTPNEDKKDSVSISHPLSDCDVDIKFDGQSTKLKQIRPMKTAMNKQT